MTRTFVYCGALVAFVAATALTLAAILLPNWASYSAAPDITYTYGLHEACSSIHLTDAPATGPPKIRCRPFPEPADCHGEDRYFCSLWRSTGFLMSLAAVLELVVLVAFVVILAGGKEKRQRGWKLMTGSLLAVGATQCFAMSIVAYLFDNDDRFIPGWKLDESWILCTVSWSITVLAAAFVAISAFAFPTEDGYELIPSERQYG
ncbi:MAG: hypothetical protein M1818_005987 [Claussenomyces sp. TS43310]|nr:MAG: hypothetical protein M1818_005987 [Claussenomyces sp. TS43310]